jgi:hypothetical protein
MPAETISTCLIVLLLLLLLLQIRALSELSWFFMTGTSSQ